MPQSLTRLLHHLVFSTKHREPTILDLWRPELHSYIGGILRHRRGDLIAAGGIEDHIHLLVRIPPTICPADLIRDVKSNSSLWRRNQGDSAFGWQNGYGAFTVSPTMTQKVIEYINNQREHHRTVTFQEEYLAFMNRYGVEYDERYVWDRPPAGPFGAGHRLATGSQGFRPGLRTAAPSGRNTRQSPSAAKRPTYPAQGGSPGISRANNLRPEGAGLT